VRITAVWKLAVEAADNGLSGTGTGWANCRDQSVKSHGVRVGNWLSLIQAQALPNAPDARRKKGLSAEERLCPLVPMKLASKQRLNWF
jgi:hypothetical protein